MKKPFAAIIYSILIWAMELGRLLLCMEEIYKNNSEFGHIKITNRDVRCDCGKKGCLEAVASGHAIERIAKSSLKKTQQAPNLSAKEVAELAFAGNEDAIRIFSDVGRYLGTCNFDCCNTF